MDSTGTRNGLWSKTNLALVCALGMVGGFLVSRVLLSIAVFAFGGIAIYDVHPRRWFKERWWILGVLWVAFYALSWFWTDDKDNWHFRFDVKLPILLLPLAFAFLPPFTVKQLRIFFVGAALMLLASAAYSVSFLIKDPQFYSEQYVYSHMLPTLAYHDHIRYSLAIALFISWGIYIWPALGSKGLRWFAGISIALLAIYLHILAARSGLAVLYLFLICYCLRLIFSRKAIVGIVTLLVLGIGAFLAVRYIPTLEKRVWYVKETYRSYTTGEMSANLNDVGRLISYKLAAGLIKEHPIAGVGAGDMQHEMEARYSLYYNTVPAEFRLIPHNQFMIVALGCGLPPFIIFLIWAFWPLKWVQRDRSGFFMFITWLSLILALMVEPMLEVQMGVFVFLFFLLWQSHTQHFTA